MMRNETQDRCDGDRQTKRLMIRAGKDKPEDHPAPTDPPAPTFPSDPDPDPIPDRPSPPPQPMDPVPPDPTDPPVISPTDPPAPNLQWNSKHTLAGLNGKPRRLKA